MENRKIRLSEIEANEGQIEGLPKNPRTWEREDLERLKRSIQETPELLEARGLIVTPHQGKYVVLGGNMRFAAVKELGLEDITAHIIPEETSLKTKKEVVIKDNGQFGKWNADSLANEWSDNPLGDWGVEDWDLGIEEDSSEDQPGQVTPPAAKAQQRIIICYKTEQGETLGRLLGLGGSPDKVVYKITHKGLE